MMLIMNSFPFFRMGGERMGKNKRTKMSFSVLYNKSIYHLLLLPSVILLLIFSYAPMVGIVMAFQKYHPRKGLLGSDFIGFDNFRILFLSSSFDQVIFNTVYIALLKIIASIIVPVLFALLLNEIKNRHYVKTIQTAIYLPYFLSWVILSGIFIEILSPSTGIVNSIIKFLGGDTIYFLGDKNIFRYTLIVTDTWKNFGYGTIIYLAALTAIDPGLYEAAVVDGANHWHRLLHITLPGITPIIILMTVLGIGNLLNAGFDQVFNLINASVYETGEIIDLTVYNIGLRQANFSLATAVGLFKSIIGFGLILLSHKLAYKFAGYRVF